MRLVKVDDYFGAGEKCRASKAYVIGADLSRLYKPQTIHDYVYRSSHDPKFEYKIGEWVVPDSFDDNRFDECSNGIHFFMRKEEAEKY